MNFQIACPGCGSVLAVEAEPGQQIACPGCAAVLVLTPPPDLVPDTPAYEEPDPALFDDLASAMQRTKAARAEAEPVEAAAPIRGGAARSKSPAKPPAKSPGKRAAAAVASNGSPVARADAVEPDEPEAPVGLGAKIRALIDQGWEKWEGWDRNTRILAASGAGAGIIVTMVLMAVTIRAIFSSSEVEPEKPVGPTPVASKTDTPVPVPPPMTDHNEVSVWLPPGVKVLGPHRMALGDIVTAVACSPDGKLVAAGGWDKTVRVFDAVSGRMRHRLVGHTGPIWAVAFSPDGRTVASAGSDKQVRLWDVSVGRMTRAIDAGDKPLRALAFNKTGKLLAAGGDDAVLMFYDTGTGVMSRSLRGHEDTIQAIAYSPDGEWIATACRDGYVRLFSTGGAQAQMFPLTGHQAKPSDVAFSPDGKTLASVDEARQVILWDTAKRSGRKQFTVAADGSRGPGSLSYSRDGAWLAVGGPDGLVKVWNAESPGGPPAQTLGGHTGAVASVRFGKGTLLATGSIDRTVRVWDAATGTERRADRAGHTGYVYGAAFSPDGKHLATVGDDRSLHVWNVESAEAPPEVVAGHAQGARSVAWSRDGSRIATAACDNLILLWNAPERKVIKLLRAHGREVMCLAFSNDGRKLISGSLDDSGNLRLWDLTVNRENTPSVVLAGHTGPVNAVALAGAGPVAASASSDGTVKIWNTLSGRANVDFSAPGAAPQRAVAFSPDDAWLAAAGDDGIVRILDVESGAVLTEIAALRGPVRSLAFKRDGKALAVSGLLGEVVELDTADNSLLRWFQFPSPIEGIAYAPDGRTLATANGNTSVYLIDVARVSDPLQAMAAVEGDGDAALWIKDLREQTQSKEFFTAVESLKSLGADMPPAAVPALIYRLHDSSDDIANTAIDALGAMGPEVAPILSAAYRLNDNAKARLAILDVFGLLGTKAASASGTIAAALGDSNKSVRQAAAESLGKLGPAAALTMLPLLADKDPQVRATAEKALADDKMLPTLLAAAGPTKDRKLRLTALAAIGNLGNKAEKPALPLLIEALEDKDMNVRIAAAGALAKVDTGNADTVTALAMFVGSVDEDRKMRIAAMGALGALGRSGGAAAPAITAIFEEKDEELAYWAAQTLAMLGPLDPAAGPGLIKGLNDKRWQVRAQMVEVFANMGANAKDILDELKKRAVAETDEEVRRKFAVALRKIEAAN